MAGVAKSTVSRYLNNGSVSEKTKQKLQKIIEETDYVPNQFAQSLKAQRSNMIGIVLPRFDSPSTNQVLKGIDDLAYQKGYQLVLTNSNLDIEREKENIALLERQKVSAIILIASFMDQELNEQINKLDIPILIIGQQINGRPSLIHEDYEAGQQIAEHALNLGHRDLLFVGVSTGDNSVGIMRRDGFMDIVRKARARVEFIETSFSKKEAYQQALEYLPNESATYIAAATDHIAIGIGKAAHDLGLNIPNDFSLSGFGGYSESEYASPSITTVEYPFYEIGTNGLQLIEKLIRGEEIPMVTTMTNQLHVKQSTNKLNKK